ncbi:unnamed protein product [Lactuca virosa]|uniref:Uncharacterized protein n=1 Tax=Lactuca virosa TaxID=75947 RepID=A0AAU9NRP5_9ASTR|nr:unnamed protein product [Lactuca virosa]
MWLSIEVRRGKKVLPLDWKGEGSVWGGYAEKYGCSIAAPNHRHLSFFCRQGSRSSLLPKFLPYCLDLLTDSPSCLASFLIVSPFTSNLPPFACTFHSVILLSLIAVSCLLFSSTQVSLSFSSSKLSVGFKSFLTKGRGKD